MTNTPSPSPSPSAVGVNPAWDSLSALSMRMSLSLASIQSLRFDFPISMDQFTSNPLSSFPSSSNSIATTNPTTVNNTGASSTPSPGPPALQSKSSRTALICGGISGGLCMALLFGAIFLAKRYKDRVKSREIEQMSSCTTMGESRYVPKMLRMRPTDSPSCESDVTVGTSILFPSFPTNGSGRSISHFSD